MCQMLMEVKDKVTFEGNDHKNIYLGIFSPLIQL